MEVRVYPNSRRPGVGSSPRREARRSFIPPHLARRPLEAGSALGYMVYAALEPNESFSIGFEGDGRYTFVYYLHAGGEPTPVFTLTMTMSVGNAGMMKEDLAFPHGLPAMPREAALAFSHIYVVPEDMGTPAGGIALRGATNFRTPPGWDTVYSPVFNMVERPVPPMLIVRVETDWYAHETEFRYVLQPGERFTITRTVPIGQVFFVPREEISMRDCTAEELEALRSRQRPAQPPII